MQTDRLSYQKISFPTIVLAIEGDPEALLYILDHYRNYIRKINVTRMHDDQGNIHHFIDEYACGIIESTLLEKITEFEFK
jgi:hypothetical protein